MSIPTPFNPLGTLGASPLPPGYHSVEYVTFPSTDPNVFFRLDNITCDAGIPEFLIDVESVEGVAVNAYIICYWYGLPYDYAIRITGNMYKFTIGDGRVDTSILAAGGRAVLKCKGGVYTCTVNGELVASGLKAEQGSFTGRLLSLQRLANCSNLIRKSYYKCGSTSVTLLPCVDNTGNEYIYIPEFNEMVSVNL